MPSPSGKPKGWKTPTELCWHAVNSLWHRVESLDNIDPDSHDPGWLYRGKQALGVSTLWCSAGHREGDTTTNERGISTESLSIQAQSWHCGWCLFSDFISSGCQSQPTGVSEPPESDLRYEQKLFTFAQVCKVWETFGLRQSVHWLTIYFFCCVYII